MLQGSKLVVALAHPYILAPHPLLSPYYLPYTWIKREDKR
jgi:hypothetical protein